MIVDFTHAHTKLIYDILDLPDKDRKYTCVRASFLNTLTYLGRQWGQEDQPPAIHLTTFPFYIIGPAVMMSHTGLRSVCESVRNVDDETIQRIANVGGIMGIALFRPAICGNDSVASFVRTVQRVVHITGTVGNVALGSDWDGNVMIQITSDRVDILSAALINIGNFSREEVERIMFDNVKDFFMRSLPQQ